MRLTLSSYLLQHHSRQFVNPSAAKLRLALLCTSYLTFPCFNPSLDLSDIEVSVHRGDYAFQEYAALNWIHHIECLNDYDKVAINVDTSSLKNAVVILYQRHLGQLAIGNPDLSIQDPGLHIHSISAALDKLRMSYDIVNNIYVNETNSGKVITLIALACS